MKAQGNGASTPSVGCLHPDDIGPVKVEPLQEKSRGTVLKRFSVLIVIKLPHQLKLNILFMVIIGREGEKQRTGRYSAPSCFQPQLRGCFIVFPHLKGLPYSILLYSYCFLRLCNDLIRPGGEESFRTDPGAPSRLSFDPLGVECRHSELYSHRLFDGRGKFDQWRIAL